MIRQRDGLNYLHRSQRRRGHAQRELYLGTGPDYPYQPNSQTPPFTANQGVLMNGGPSALK
jgi:hypothetical protein